MLQMSNHLYFLQRRAAEAGILVRHSLRMDGLIPADLSIEDLVSTVYSHVQDVLNDGWLEEIDNAQEVSMYVIDQLEMDLFLREGTSAEAYYHAGANLKWKLEGFDD